MLIIVLNVKGLYMSASLSEAFITAWIFSEENVKELGFRAFDLRLWVLLRGVSNGVIWNEIIIT